MIYLKLIQAWKDDVCMNVFIICSYRLFWNFAKIAFRILGEINKIKK